MKNKLIPVIATLMIALIVGTSACAPAPKKVEAPAKTITITDSAGRIVEIPQPLERVVVFVFNHAVPLQAIGAVDKVVGIGKGTARAKVILPHMSKKEQVGTILEPNLEMVVKLNPQVVLAYPELPSPEKLEKLLPEEIKVVRLDLMNPETMRGDIKLLGRILGKEERAKEYADFWFSKIEMIQGRVKDLKEEERVRVYLEVWKPYETVVRGSGYHEVIEMAGGINIAEGHGFVGGLRGVFPIVEPEWVVAQNPDVVIKVLREHDCFGNPDNTILKEARKAIMERPGFDQINAVKEGRVYTISFKLGLAAFQNVLACYLAKAFYPELFKELDPEGYLKEMVEKYLGLKYEDVKGAYTYPKL